MIKYIGSKRTLIPDILAAVARVAGAWPAREIHATTNVPDQIPPADAHRARPVTVLDLFSGTSRVGHALKAEGYRVIANDYNAYAAMLAQCYVAADREECAGPAQRIIDELNSLKGEPGYFTQTFCLDSRYIQPVNGERIDAIREWIARADLAQSLASDLRAVLLVSLMEAADRVDSTTGLQMAYLKSWSQRSHNPLMLRLPALLPQSPHGKGQAHRHEALMAATTLHADIAYVDPPYNQHSYLGNYHVWESLISWDKPAVYGIACKREDVRQRQSIFNSKPRFAGALSAVLNAIRAPAIVVSFNNEGYIGREEMETLLGSLWGGTAHVETFEHNFRRYIGARIGIYNPKGAKVGTIGHTTNKEFIYIASRFPLGTAVL